MHALRTPAAKPFPELADPPADYEMSIWLNFTFNDYRETPAGVWLPVVCGDYVLECGREAGRWRLGVSPRVGEENDGGDVLDPPVLDARDQIAGDDPLALMRALLSGGSA